MVCAPGNKSWPNLLLYNEAENMDVVSSDASAQFSM